MPTCGSAASCSPHGEKRGGSTLELVAHEKGLPKQPLKGVAFFEAWGWLYERGCLPDPPAKPNGDCSGLPPILATYSYPDEGGTVLYRAVRFDTQNPKERFKQQRPDGNGGWIWGTKGIRRVLYRLPELIEAVKAGQRVLVCEGERDDECYGPQDKSAEGRLKRLITEPGLHIEPKGREPATEPRLHVMMASNHDWVVPAGQRERRYAVQDVAETHVQDPKWFDPIYQEMGSGGLGAMLYDLLHYDLGNWHPRRIVRTQALAKQQEESLSPLDQWWLDLLQTGVLTGTNEYDPDRAISNHYEEELTETNSNGGKYKRTVKREGLYDQARRSSPKLKGTSDTALGRYLGKDGCGCENDWIYAGGRARRGWKFPPLEECRKRREERFPATVWHDPKTTKWTFGGN